jgi:hypothetical protein
MKKLIVILAAIALVGAFSLPAAAAVWKFYGSARMSSFSTTADPGGGADDDTDTNWDLQGNSRLGANVKAGDVSGRFEYGTGVNVRILRGTWNFGAGSLLVGQDYTPLNYFPSNQVFGGDADLLPYGGVYRGRRPMIQLSFGTFKLALVQPNAASDLGTGGDVDIMLPNFELSYRFKTDMFYIDVFGGYQTYGIDANAASTADLDVSSYIGGVNLGVNVGPVSIMGSAYAGQNLGPYGMWVTGDANPAVAPSGTETVDNDSYGLLGVVNFKATDALSFEVGYGYLQHELDGAVEADDTTSGYVNAVITFAPGVFIVPEIGMVDYGNSSTGADQGDDFYFGAKWQINF